MEGTIGSREIKEEGEEVEIEYILSVQIASEMGEEEKRRILFCS